MEEVEQELPPPITLTEEDKKRWCLGLRSNGRTLVLQNGHPSPITINLQAVYHSNIRIGWTRAKCNLGGHVRFQPSLRSRTIAAVQQW